MFDDIYNKNKNFWGGIINPLLEEALKYVEEKSTCLDLGCGQGKEFFYLSQKSFSVDGVEISEIAVEQIGNIIKKEKLENVFIKESDIAKYDICKDKYDLIISFSALHFLEKEGAYKVINDIRTKIKDNGVVAICAFTEENSTFESAETKVKYHFKKDELRELFSDFEIIYYSEDVVNDKAHGPKGHPHKHGIVNIIAKK